jgi:superfamily II DNA or RNA helicase
MWSGLARAPLIFADEAHHTLTIERFGLLESRFSPEALRVALTATPDYDEVRALCRFFPRLIHELPLEDALDLGLLAPLRVWVLEVDADASGVRVVAGDYDDATLGSVMGSPLFLDAALRLRYAPANRNTRALVTCRTRAQAHQRPFLRAPPARRGSSCRTDSGRYEDRSEKAAPRRL